MSDFTNEAIQVARRLEEIAELMADGDQDRNTLDNLYMERAELEEKDRYLTAYFKVVNKNLELEQQLKTAKADAVREFVKQQFPVIPDIDQTAAAILLCIHNAAEEFANNLEGK